MSPMLLLAMGLVLRQFIGQYRLNRGAGSRRSEAAAPGTRSRRKRGSADGSSWSTTNALRLLRRLLLPLGLRQ